MDDASDGSGTNRRTVQAMDQGAIEGAMDKAQVFDQRIIEGEM